MEKFYDQVAGTYDDFVDKAQYAVPGWLKGVAARLAGRTVAVLDLGCANGRMGRMLKEFGVIPSPLIGVDISGAMVGCCRRSGYYSEVFCHDLAGGLPALAREFDVVTALGMLEFIPDCSGLLGDIQHRLRSGGELWATFELAAGAATVIETKTRDLTVRRYPRSEAEVRGLVARAGFELVERHAVTGYVSPTTGRSVPYALCRAVNAGKKHNGKNPE